MLKLETILEFTMFINWRKFAKYIKAYKMFVPKEAL